MKPEHEGLIFTKKNNLDIDSVNSGNELALNDLDVSSKAQNALSKNLLTISEVSSKQKLSYDVSRNATSRDSENSKIAIQMSNVK